MHITVLMPERTNYDAQFDSSPRRESHFLRIFLCKLLSPFSEMAAFLSSTILYHFKVVVDIVGSKSNFMGHARTSQELRFHEDKILEPEIMLYVTVSTTLPSCALDFCIGCNMQRIATPWACVC